MTRELEEYREHWKRFRAVTLQTLELVQDEDLAFRPVPEMMTLGQQLLHIPQSEDFLIRGLFDSDWDRERLRLPRTALTVEELKTFYRIVGARTDAVFQGIDEGILAEGVGDPPVTRWSHLWTLLEHEVHHKAQMAVYLRLLGIVPPFFAEPLEVGERPDVEAREGMGGV